MIKTVFITGGCGFVGRYLMAHYLKLGWFVTIYDDLSTGSLEHMQFHPRLSFHQGSVLDIEKMAPLIERSDLIIHLASVVGVRLAHSRAEYAYCVCVQGTENVIAASKDQPLVLISSSAVYGLDHREIMFENDICDEKSVLEYDGGIPGYATGKLHMENLARKALCNGRKVLLVRPFNLVGSGQSGDFGMVLPTFVKRALAGLPLQVYNDGMQTRSFSDIEIFISILGRLIESPAAWQHENFIVNIGNPNDTSILSLAEMVLQACDVNGTIEFVPFDCIFPGKRDPRVRIPGSIRIKSLLGEIEWKGVRQIVQRVVDYERSRMMYANVRPPIADILNNNSLHLNHATS